MDVLNLEAERGRLSALTKKRKESLKNHYFPDRPLLDDFIKGQRKLVTALEQLEQAREALDAIRMHPAVRNSFAGRQIIELAEQVLEQQEVG